MRHPLLLLHLVFDFKIDALVTISGSENVTGHFISKIIFKLNFNVETPPFCKLLKYFFIYGCKTFDSIYPFTIHRNVKQV